MKLLFIICCVIYILRIIIIVAASYKERKNKKENVTINDSLPFISVIVPARNEEKNIAECIRSIIKSDYPKNKFELIVVNDRSDDNTANIVKQFTEEYDNVILKNITEETKNQNLRGKPGALQAGFDIAKGEIFLMTDADCTVNEQWITTIVSQFLNENDNTINKNVGLVAAYTSIKGENIFAKFQDAEWTYMNTYASAGIGLGTALGCFGNNLAVSKEAYYKIGGYHNLEFSVTEDYALLKAVLEGKYEVRYICDKKTNVETLACPTIKEYIKQHKRWAIGGISLGWKAFLHVLSSACITATFIIAIIETSLILLAINVIIRILGDVFVLFPIYNILDRRHLKRGIIIFITMCSILEIIIPFTLINQEVEWKGQVFKKN